MFPSRAEAILYFSLVLVTAHQRDHGDQNIRSVIETILSTSALPLIAQQGQLPTFDKETFDSIEHDEHSPCLDAKHERYRRPNGFCNNLRHPFQGAVLDTQRRAFSNYFQDGRNFPRVQDKDFNDLPSPRVLSLECFELEEDDDGPGSEIATQLVWQFGQLLAHDMTLTEKYDVGNTCCDNYTRGNPYADLYNSDGKCFPIEIPPIDPHFNESCMIFSRTYSIQLYGVREIVNGITSYVDGSVIYGASTKRLNDLRAGVQGLLKSDIAHGLEQLPRFGNFPCVPTVHIPRCPASGDARLTDHKGLESMHTMFHLDHNRIARKMYRVNRHWDDERIFQETRKIISGIIQKIVYEDLLPLLVGDDVMRVFHINAPYVYDENVDGGAVLEFTSTSLRYGHSMINTRVQGIDIGDLYFRPTSAEDLRTVPFFQAHHAAHDFNIGFSKQVRDRMYERVPIHGISPFPGPSFDLLALNIQRGRDNGIPPYTVVRDFCLELLHGVQGLHNDTPACLARGIYKHEEDIDLFVGGQSERPLPNAVLGPTFACLAGIQFQRSKFGDRFFYEGEGIEGFNTAQRHFIQRNTLASIICELNPDRYLQRDVFRPVSNSNPLQPCHKILYERDLDKGLELWKETVHHHSQIQHFIDLLSVSGAT